MRDVRAMCGAIAENDYIGRVDIDQLALGTGAARLKVDIAESVLYGIVGEQTGMPLSGMRPT